MSGHTHGYGCCSLGLPIFKVTRRDTHGCRWLLFVFKLRSNTRFARLRQFPRAALCLYTLLSSGITSACQKWGIRQTRSGFLLRASSVINLISPHITIYSFLVFSCVSYTKNMVIIQNLSPPATGEEKWTMPSIQALLSFKIFTHFNLILFNLPSLLLKMESVEPHTPCLASFSKGNCSVSQNMIPETKCNLQGHVVILIWQQIIFHHAIQEVLNLFTTGDFKSTAHYVLYTP